MKLWLDSSQPAPFGYTWVRNANEAIMAIEETENRRIVGMFDMTFSITLIDVNSDDDEYVDLFNWLTTTFRNYPISIYSHNKEGIKKIKETIERNGWEEV